MNVTYKLSELVNTRFLYVTIGLDIKYILNTCEDLKSNPNKVVNAGNALQEDLYKHVSAGYTPVFDLAGCWLTSDITQIIFEWQNKGWMFIDSQDNYRAKILQNNLERIEQSKKETVTMPIFKLNTSVKDYIANLRTDVTYTYYENSDVCKALIIMTAMLRPSVHFAMDNVMSGILDIVSTALPTATLLKYDKFYYHTPEGVEVVEAVDGMLQTQRVGTVPVEQASYGGYLVPTVFGEQVLYKDPGWSTVFKNSLSFLNRAKEMRLKTLREVLVGD